MSALLSEELGIWSLGQSDLLCPTFDKRSISSQSLFDIQLRINLVDTLLMIGHRTS